MVVPRIDGLGDGANVGGGSGGCNDGGQSENNQIAQDGSWIHKSSLRDDLPEPTRFSSYFLLCMGRRRKSDILAVFELHGQRVE